MRRAIVGAVIGCAFGLVVGSFVTEGIRGASLRLTVIACMTPFAIVGAVVCGTGAILAKLERMSPEPTEPTDRASQILREKQKLPYKIPLPTEDESE